MSAFWQRVIMSVLAAGALVLAQLVIKDQTARDAMMGIAGLLVGAAHITVKDGAQ